MRTVVLLMQRSPETTASRQVQWLWVLEYRHLCHQLGYFKLP
jgi:hypothetical protein